MPFPVKGSIRAIHHICCKYTASHFFGGRGGCIVEFPPFAVSVQRESRANWHLEKRVSRRDESFYARHFGNIFFKTCHVMYSSDSFVFNDVSDFIRNEVSNRNARLAWRVIHCMIEILEWEFFFFVNINKSLRMKSVKITLEEFLYDSTNPVTLSSSFNPFVQTIYLHGGTRIATFKRWNIFFIPLTKIYYQFSRESIQLITWKILHFRWTHH